MHSLDQILKQIDQSCAEIQTLKFNRLGMFTNAMVNPPTITQLVLDPTPDEASLYKISKLNLRKRARTSDGSNMEATVERIDGRSLYALETDLTNLPVADDDDDDQSIVKAARLKRRQLSKPYFKIDVDTDNIPELIGRISRAIELRPSLIDKYPQYAAKVRHYRRQYEVDSQMMGKLQEEIRDLEQAIEALGSEVREGEYDDGVVCLDRLIRKEQEEILELERKLNEEDI